MPPSESWVNPKVGIQESSLSGKGMFALEPLTSGELILMFGGEFITGAQAKEEAAKGKLVMQWDDDLWSAEDRGDDPTYFLNHSCDPNTWMKDAWTVVAKRDIAANEEITADYVVWEADENYVASWECVCGSPSCRKRITGKDWRLPEVQERYKDHLVPFIERRFSK